MHCFNHSEAEAVGICKSCQRAICLSCVAEVGKSVACTNRCEDDVRALNEMIQYNVEVFRSTDMKKLTADSAAALRWSRSIALGADWFLIILGAVFLTYSVYDRSTFLGVMGVAFVSFGVFGLVRTKAPPPSSSVAK